jgi:hypothetical protein
MSTATDIWTDGGTQLVFKRGGGTLMLLGLPFLLFGLFTIGGALNGQLIQNSSTPVAPYGIALFGSVFAALGAMLTLGRAGIVIDRAAGQVTTWWGLLVAFSRRVDTLSAFEVVALTKKVIRTRNGSRTTYPVTLEGAAKPVTIGTPRRSNEARQLAERVAKFLNLGIRDSSSGVTVEREAGRLDESVGDRMARMGETTTWPTRPLDCRVVYERAGDEAILEIPPIGFHPVLLLFLAFTVVIAAITGRFVFSDAWWSVGSGSGFERVPALIMAGAFVLPVVVVVGFIFTLVTMVQRIRVSPRELRVQYRCPLFTREKCLPARAIEELKLGGTATPEGKPLPNTIGAVVLATSDEEHCAFGSTRVEDVRWVYDVVRHILAGNRPR